MGWFSSSVEVWKCPKTSRYTKGIEYNWAKEFFIHKKLFGVCLPPLKKWHYLFRTWQHTTTDATIIEFKVTIRFLGYVWQKPLVAWLRLKMTVSLLLTHTVVLLWVWKANLLVRNIMTVLEHTHRFCRVNHDFVTIAIRLVLYGFAFCHWDSPRWSWNEEDDSRTTDSPKLN